MRLFRYRSDDVLRPLGLRNDRRSLGSLAIRAALVVLIPTAAFAAYQPSSMLGVNNLSELSNAATARTNLGLGSAATQASTIFTQVANNLSDLASAATARTNLGLGTLSTQAASSAAITGGTIDGTTIGGTTRASVSATTGNFNGILTTSSGQVRNVRVVVASGNVTMATTDDLVVVNKTTGAATVVNAISSPTTGTVHCVKDGKGDAATNNITFTPAAGNVDGSATYVLNQNYQAACFFYNGTIWNII